MPTRTSGQRRARAMGWFSAAVGLPAVLAPAALNRAVGVRPTDGSNAVARAVGVQELAAALPLLRRPRPAGWQWSRVAGDAAHLLLLSGAGGDAAGDARRVRRAMAAVAGCAVVDVATAVALSRRTSRTPPARVEARRGVTVRRPPDEVYRYWRDLGNLPTFMAHLRSVETSIGGRRSHWVAEAPIGTVEWDAEITVDRPGEILAWRSLEGADVANRGMVRFVPAPGDQGTEVHVEISYDPPGRKAAAVVAKLFGEDPDQQMADDLRRFKQVLETGEVVVSDGSPEGTLTRRLLKQRAARPLTEREAQR